MTEERAKGIGLCRVSTIEQGKGTSLESQEDWVRKEAENRNVELVEVIKKEVSGVEFPKEIANRIFGLTKTVNISFIFVYQVDRLTREMLAGLQLIKEIEKRNILIVTSDGALNPHDLTGSLILKQKMLFSEYENETRRERIQRGITTRLKNGEFTFKNVPFGYGRDMRNHLFLKPECIPIIKFIFDTFIQKKSYRRTLAKVNQRYKDRELNYSMIRKILKDPIYIGELTWGNYGKRDEKYIFQELKCIEEDVFFKAQLIVEQLEKKYQRHEKKIPEAVAEFIEKQGLEIALKIVDCLTICCPKCHGTELQKNGKEVIGGIIRYKYVCKTCGHGFRLPSKRILNQLESFSSSSDSVCDNDDLNHSDPTTNCPVQKIPSSDLTPWLNEEHL